MGRDDRSSLRLLELNSQIATILGVQVLTSPGAFVVEVVAVKDQTNAEGTDALMNFHRPIR